MNEKVNAKMIGNIRFSVFFQGPPFSDGFQEVSDIGRSFALSIPGIAFPENGLVILSYKRNMKNSISIFHSIPILKGGGCIDPFSDPGILIN